MYYKTRISNYVLWVIEYIIRKNARYHIIIIKLIYDVAEIKYESVQIIQTKYKYPLINNHNWNYMTSNFWTEFLFYNLSIFEFFHNLLVKYIQKKMIIHKII